MNKTAYFFIALAVMAGVTYLIRLLPLLFVRKKIKNVFLRSFLYYLPYTVLATMSFPTILYCTGNIVSGIVACLGCMLFAYKGKGLITVAIGGAGLVLLTEVVTDYLIPWVSGLM